MILLGFVIFIVMASNNKKHKVTLILTARQVRLILSRVKDYSITASAEDWDKIINGSLDKKT